MKKNKLLVNFLYRLFTVLFIGTILFFILVVGFEVLTNDGKVGNFHIGNHHSIGYSLPVSIKTNVRNPVFNNRKSINIRESVNVKGQKIISSNSVYVNELPKDINTETKSILSFHFEDTTEYFTTNESSFRYDGYIVAKSKNLFIQIIQIFKTYSGLIASMLMFYFLMRIFYSLKKELSFTNFLFQNVKWLGLVLIISEILRLWMSYILGSYYGLIDVRTLIDGKIFSNGIDLTINPRLEFGFTLFIVGLSLVVLASLLKSGNTIEQENELTI